MTNEDAAGHLLELAGTPWRVWRSALLRTTGFPAAGLDRLAAPAAASAADALLAATGSSADFDPAFDPAFDEALRQTSAEIYTIAEDPLFREAVTWQNRTALHAVNGIRKQGPVAVRNSQRRQREEVIAQYWQRYCAKNETVGFFGPVSWLELDPGGDTVTLQPGPGLVRDRQVFFEHWALSAFADTVAADARVRPWLPVALAPQLCLSGRSLLRPAQSTLTLTAAEAALLARCDGRRVAIEVADEVADDPGTPVRTRADALMLLGQLAERGLLRWNIDLPVRLHAEQVLAQQLASIGDVPAREWALAGLDRMRTARDRVAEAAGDPDTLHGALDHLDRVFTELTNQTAQRKDGQMYAGRTLCVEECVRDLTVTLGGALLPAIAAPLSILMQAARWLTAAAGTAYLEAIRALYDELAAEVGSPRVPFGQLWYLAQGLFFGTPDMVPITTVTAEFTRRWAELFGLDRSAPGTRRIAMSSAELAQSVHEVFPAAAPGWSAARVHAPDLHICAASGHALEQGDFTLVLGELHTAWVTFDSELFLVGAPDREGLRDALRTDIGPGRMLPLLPITWPRYTARLAGGLDNATDWQLGFVSSPGADPQRLVPVTALTISDEDGDLIVSAPDGRHWPVLELCAEFIGIHTQSAFKLVAGAGHTPRITVDRMVVARETWRTTLGESGLAQARGEREQYLAARRWRARLGLPERVFVGIPTETKPCYLDLTSPAYVSAWCAMLRAARRVAGDEVELTITEMVPTPDQAWVPDAAGQRYFSELRIQVTDPRHSATGSRP